MHELSITQSIVELVADHAKGQRVRRVTLEIGQCTGVMTDAIRFCFDLATEGTVLEGATLDIYEIEGRALCAACGKEFPRRTLSAPCPCGAFEFTRISGEELRVKTYELARA